MAEKRLFAVEGNRIVLLPDLAEGERQVLTAQQALEFAEAVTAKAGKIKELAEAEQRVKVLREGLK